MTALIRVLPSAVSCISKARTSRGITLAPTATVRVVIAVTNRMLASEPVFKQKTNVMDMYKKSNKRRSIQEVNELKTKLELLEDNHEGIR
jgi:hypothetical protein